MKSVVVDSSSIILLQKAALLPRFLNNYSVTITASVFTELTLVQKEGAVELLKLLTGCIKKFSEHNSLDLNMGRGERDTIVLQQQGYGDFILIDDKRAANYCRSKKIPFINSLLVPRIFFFVGILDEAECQEKVRELAELGYYSKEIIELAKSFSRDRLCRFFPSVGAEKKEV